MLGNHLLGIYEKAMPDSLDWERRFRLAGELGFDFVELSIDESDARLERLDWSDEEQDRFRMAVRASGLGLQSLCLSAHRRFPLGSASPETARRAGEIMERAILLAHALGIRLIQLAGYDVYYEPSTPETVARFTEGLHRACALAARYQVMLSMEIMDTPLMSSITRYLHFSRTLDSPWFTVYPDLGNLSAWRDNDVLRELNLGRREIVAVHVKETLAESDNAPGVFKRVPFGSGCVDFPAAFQTLERLGFQGPYTIEMWYENGQDVRYEIAKAKRFIEDQFARGVLE